MLGLAFGGGGEAEFLVFVAIGKQYDIADTETTLS